MASPPLAAVRATAAAIVLQVLALAATVARVIARRKGELQIGVDDYALFISLFGSVGITAAIVNTALKGWLFVPPTIIERDDPQGNSRYRLYQFIISILGHIFLCIVKISVVLFYKRIFKTKKFILAANLSMATIVTYMIVIFVLCFVSNDPISAFWKLGVNQVPVQRIPMNMILLVSSVLSIALDLLVLLLPLPAIRNLQMSRRRKIYITGIFLVATICLIGSGLRLYYFQHYATLRKQLGRADTAPAESLANYFLWTQYEMCIAIIASCLLTLRPLFPRKKTLLSENRVYPAPSSQSRDSLKDGLGAVGGPVKGPLMASLQSPRREWFEAHLDISGVEVDITADDAEDAARPNTREKIVVRNSITTEESFR